MDEAIAEQMRTVVLDPGQYLLIEIPEYTTNEMLDAIKAQIPEDLRGRTVPRRWPLPRDRRG